MLIKRNYRFYLWFFLASFLLQGISFSQQTDSLIIFSDSTLALTDTVSIPKRSGKTYDVDTTVFAASKDSLIFFVKEKR